MNYPTLPKLPDSTPKPLRDAFEALETWFRRVKADGGLITGNKLAASGVPVAPDPVYHSELSPVTPSASSGYVIGVSAFAQLVATLRPGEYLSRLSVSWLTSGVAGYDVELWQGVTFVASLSTIYTSCRFSDLSAGSYAVRVRTAASGITPAGPWTTVTVVVGGAAARPDTPSQLTATIDRARSVVRLVWTAAQEIDVVGYRLAFGPEYSDATTFVQVGIQTEYEWTPLSASSAPFWVVAVDSSGVESIPRRSTSDLTIVAPLFSESSLNAEVLDNTVLLRWTAATMGTYPVDHYEIRKGDPLTATFETAEIIGTVGGTFTPVYEQQAGGRKYWVRAIDRAGLGSDYGVVYATVAENDFFALYDESTSQFTGTLDNALVGSGATLALPVNLILSWNDHFTNNPDV